MYPSSNAYPPLSATYLPMQTARVSAALPGAGAWDATPLELVCGYFLRCTLYFTYTRGGAGGAFDFQVEYSPYSVVANVPAGAQEWITMGLLSNGAVVAGADTQSREQREYVTYQATSAVAEDIPYPIDLSGAAERVRVIARESGAVGTPGTLQVEAVFA